MKYDYDIFKAAHTEHNGNISKIAEALNSTRPTCYLWLEKMQRDDALIEKHCIGTGRYAEQVAIIKEIYTACFNDYSKEKQAKLVNSYGALRNIATGTVDGDAIDHLLEAIMAIGIYYERSKNVAVAQEYLKGHRTSVFSYLDFIGKR